MTRSDSSTESNAERATLAARVRHALEQLRASVVFGALAFYVAAAQAREAFTRRPSRAELEELVRRAAYGSPPQSVAPPRGPLSYPAPWYAPAALRRLVERTELERQLDRAFEAERDERRRAS